MQRFEEPLPPIFNFIEEFIELKLEVKIKYFD